MELKYAQPNTVAGSLQWQAKSKFISGKDLQRDFGISLSDPNLLTKLTQNLGEKMFFAGEDNSGTDQFATWFSRIKNWESQKALSTNYSSQPAETYTDSENGNIIDVFDFSDQIGKDPSLKIDFEVKSYETTLDSISTSSKGMTAKDINQYLQPEKSLEQTAEIKKLARSITNEKDSAITQARNIFDWIVDNLKYKYPPKERGATYTLKNKSGDCGEFSLLFISLCRSIGLPARFVSGMWAISSPDTEFHAWAEFYVDGVGWIPADCTVAYMLKNKEPNFVELLGDRGNYDYFFGNLDNKRLIFSKGSNILLRSYTPGKAGASTQDSTSLFMQPDAIYPHIEVGQAGIVTLEISSSCSVLT